MVGFEDLAKRLSQLGLEFDVVGPATANVRRVLERVEPPSEVGGEVAVAVPDHTRSVPLQRVLGLLSPLLRERYRMIFATGSHSMGVGDAQRMLGEWGSKLKFEIHDSLGQHVYVGTTSRGLSVEVDARFASADFKVTAGVVAPHPWAGFSGGSKVILPGLSSLRTIVEHHLKWYSAGKPGVIEGNPFREEIEEAGKLAGVDWALNMVLDEEGKVAHAKGGEPSESFRKCMEVARSMYVRPVEGLYDSALVFTDPLDLDLYQATKALEHAAPVVDEGGSLVLVASCPRGYGSEEFKRFASMDSEAIEELLRSGWKGNIVPAIVALRMKEIFEKYSVTVLTEGSLGGLKGAELARSAQEALSRLRGRVLVIKRGGFTVPQAR
jgi:nickel-dependent lactate racemase